MKQKHLFALCLFLASAVRGFAQLDLDPFPSGALGYPPGVRATEIKTDLNRPAPNLVEGREFREPRSVAVDPASGAIYVADTGNNRVLAWRNAESFNGAPTADLVIGQRDFYSSRAEGPGGSLESGLTSPTSVAVDPSGHLFVVDTGNNRILRYPRPFDQQQQPILADFVIGQPNLNSRTANQGGLSARSIATTSGNTAFVASILFDAAGNLYFTDAGNHRVLRYGADAIGPGAANQPNANLVLGQADFTSAERPNLTATNRLSVRDRLREPSSVALDEGGRVYVADALNRVLVFDPASGQGQLFNGMAARRVMGAVVLSPGEQLPPINERGLGIVAAGNQWLAPQGVFTIGNVPFVVDTYANRILRYPVYQDWAQETPALPSPVAEAVIGQNAMRSDRIIIHRDRSEPGADTLWLPAFAIFAQGQLFVADTNNNRILVFPDISTGPEAVAGPPYAATRVLGQPGMSNRAVNMIEGREFHFSKINPANTAQRVAGAGIAIDENSNPPRLYVADPGNNRVLGFADARKIQNGEFATVVIGQPGFFRSLVNSPTNDPEAPGATGLFSPTDVAVDSDGNLYVADSGNGRVLRFPRPFDQEAGTQTADLVLGQLDFTSRNFDPSERTMRSPQGLDITIEGDLLVSDGAHHRVLLFRRDPATKTFTSGQAAAKVFGQPDFRSSGSGTGLDKFSRPAGVSTDTSARLFVCDSGNNRVVVFGDIRFAAAAGTPAVFAIGGLSTPQSVHVSAATGMSWVTDWISDRTTGFQRTVLFPAFDKLITEGPSIEGQVFSLGPLAVTEDPFGNLLVADALNRVVAHYPKFTGANNANGIRRFAPGMIASITFPRVDAIEAAVTPGIPWVKELSGIQVLFGGGPVPLHYAGPAGFNPNLNQINFLIPNDAPTNQAIEMVVVRAATGRILATSLVQLDLASPGIYYKPDIRPNQAAVINAKDGTVNSPANPAARGDYISIFATGVGFVEGAPPAGAAPGGPVWAPRSGLRVFFHSRWIDGTDESMIQYTGLSPEFPGVWQINVKVPDYIPPNTDSAAILVTMYDRVSQNPELAPTVVAVK